MQKLIVVAALAAAALTACSDPPPPPPPPEPKVETPAPTPPPVTTPPPAAPTTPPPPAGEGDMAAATAEADTIFNTRCAACHGATGKGDGLAAQALVPKPRDYSDKAWQASVTDEGIAKVIVEGGASIGKSASMVPNADLKDKPLVVKALVAKIRAIGAGGAAAPAAPAPAAK
jgi:mono/diheme cytochrome c family protein